ncbi:hypothetical protein [Streptomyces sp. NPDC051310]|uniref:hypothetical protein n=1 Tax=Streptomyces sp. NPDC051310 TaxID=3365649 RepID=UPI00379924AE
MKTLRTLRPAAVAALALALAAPVSAAHAQSPADRTVPLAAPVREAAAGVVLPSPGGLAPVGRSTLHLVDRARQDLWVPERPRELMVDMYYPARDAGRTFAPYADPREARLLLEAAAGRTPRPPRSWAPPAPTASPGPGPSAAATRWSCCHPASGPRGSP